MDRRAVDARIGLALDRVEDGTTLSQSILNSHSVLVQISIVVVRLELLLALGVEVQSCAYFESLHMMYCHGLTASLTVCWPSQ